MGFGFRNYNFNIQISEFQFLNFNFGISISKWSFDVMDQTTDCGNNVLDFNEMVINQANLKQSMRNANKKTN